MVPININILLQRLQTLPPTLGRNMTCACTGNYPSELYQAAQGGDNLYAVSLVTYAPVGESW